MRLDHLLSMETRTNLRIWFYSEVGITEEVRVEKSMIRCLILRVLFLKREEGSSPVKDGGVAQLGEHLPCKQGVRSSILLISTTVGFADEGGL